MHFKRFGKVYQLRIETPEDLDELLNLDEALWAATSAPVGAFRCDRRFLTLLDRDSNGRIASDDMREAWRWTRTRLAERRWLVEPFEALPLAALNAESPEGQALKESADYVLRIVKATDTSSLSLAQIRRCLANLDKQAFNGDGIIVAKAASDPDAAALIADAITATGGTPDAGGEQGITRAQLDAFVAATEAWLAWRDRGIAECAKGEEGAVMPFADETPAVFAAYRAVAERVDEYFALCRIRQYETSLAPEVGRRPAPSENGRVGATEWRAWLVAEPLARLSSDGKLPLCGPDVNPVHADALTALRQTVLDRCLKPANDSMDETEWQQVKERLTPYADYVATMPANGIERVPEERLRRYGDANLIGKARKLIERDMAVSGVRKSMNELERLWLYTAHLTRLANNFTSFSELYDPNRRALFERGSAVIDGRWFNLALKADDPPAHQAVARSSNIFTIYLEVERLTGEGKYTVALPATHGTKGNLREGKQGVFFDVAGIEYDARIVKIIENPISLREALVLPLFRLRDFVVGKIESISGANEKEMEKSADALFKPTPGAAPAPAAGAMGSAGVLVGVGVATAALGSAFAYISNTVIGMTAAQRLFSLLGAVAVVFVPVSLVAILKLRSQDLSSLLEAGGWAINARLRLNRAQRRQFTRKAPFPDHAMGTPRRRWWPLLLAVALGLALLVGLRMAGRRRAVSSAAAPVETVAESAEPASRQDMGQE